MDFDLRAGRVGFLMENVALMQVSVRELRLYLIGIIPPIIHNHISFIYQRRGKFKP
jgi:hypothetical protein